MLGAHGSRLLEKWGDKETLHSSVCSSLDGSAKEVGVGAEILQHLGLDFKRQDDKIDKPTLINLSVDLPILSFEPMFSFLQVHELDKRENFLHLEILTLNLK